MQRKDLLFWGREQLSHHTENAYLEAVILLRFVLKISHTHLLAHLESYISKPQEKVFRTLIEARQQGEPIAYLTGECEFWSLRFKVTPDCLIPREETERLVEKVLEHYPSHESIRILDLGTGSGAIAIAIAHQRPHWQVIATDQSHRALKVAQDNAERLGISVEFRQGDWFQALLPQESFHGIISNPPYLASEDMHLKTSLRYEPQTALIGGEKGTEMLHYLIQHAPAYLVPQGRLWLEQGFDQAKTIQSYFERYEYTHIQQYNDFSGISRITTGVAPL